MHQSILVTGASSGIGEATSVHLAHKGFRVFASARRTEKLRELEGIAGGRIRALAIDVTDEHSVQAAMDEIAAEGASLFGLVNNAGYSVLGPIETTSIEDWRREYETNVFGLLRLSQAVLPQMREAGKGRIVNIGSIAGSISTAFQGAYASSKHAVEAINDSMRRELSPVGVKVALVRPGVIDTPFGPLSENSFAEHMKEGAPYAQSIRAYLAWREKGRLTAAGPMVVAEAVHHALTAERPHARYTVPVKSMLPVWLEKFLPTALADRIISRAMGLN